jgi:histidinol-phosphate phosphatase family protein
LNGTQAVIIAGGKGTRLLPTTGDIVPKSMVPVDGVPLLARQIDTLRENGVRDILIATGHLGEVIEEYFGDGSGFGVRIRCFREDAPLGTAGALYELRGELADDFLLVFGDIVFDIDIRRFVGFHRRCGGKGTLLVHPNSHPYDSDIVLADAESGRVTGILPKNEPRDFWYDNCVNAGLYCFSSSIVDTIGRPGFADLEKDVLARILSGECAGALYAYRTPEYVKDAGTPERLEETERALRSGLVQARNLRLLQRAVFLDRDGTLNEENGLIFREEDFVLVDGAARAVRLLNDAGYLVLVVTNQPSVARGLCSCGDIETIHRKMTTLLGREGALLDGIRYCPHHPDKGFPEENPAFKIDCACRKPKTGMIDEFVRLYNIDVRASWMVGDTTVDVQAGENAGLRTILLQTGEAGKDGKYDSQPHQICDTILEAAQWIASWET